MDTPPSLTQNRRAEPRDPMAAEQNVYANVYYVLLGGMLVSSALFALGLIRYLQHPVALPLSRHWIRAQYQWAPFWHGLQRLEPTPLLLLATLLLVLTPVLRVLASIYAFGVDHDYKYVGVTSIVFLVIVLTVILSRLGLR